MATNLPAPGSDTFAPLPTNADLATLAAVMNANARASTEFGGATITVGPGDLTPVSGGSATDAQGNVWTLAPMTGQFAQFADSMSEVLENGQPFGPDGSAGWDVDLRIVNGEATWETAKGVGWFNAEGFLGQDDPGPADPGSSVGGVQADGSSNPPPVQTPPPSSGGGSPPPSTSNKFIGANQSFTDAATGNVFRLDGELNAYETPKGGKEVSLGDKGDIGWNAEAIGDVNGTIYVQDSRDGSWHTFNGSKFSGAVADPHNGGSPPPSSGGGSTPPPVSHGEPAQAIAAGYNLETFGGPLVLGKNIFPGNGSAANSGITQNADGSITLHGAADWHVNDQLDTGGQGFGGGAYIQATIAIQNPIQGWNTSGLGWPAFWGNGDLSHLPVSTETDWFEFMDAGRKNFATGMHVWDPNGEVTSSAGQGIDATAVVPPGTDLSQPHTYGWLWVPATATADGYTKMYFDGQQVGPTYDLTSGGNGPFDSLDSQATNIMFGTSASNPMTLSDLEVWQASTAKDIGGVTPVTPPPSGGGSTPPPPPPSSGMKFIHGNQSFTDAATGNTFRLDGELNAYETPKGGSEVSLGLKGALGWNAEAMGDVNGAIYIQDSRDNSWHTFDGSKFSGAVADPTKGAGSTPPPPPPPPPPATLTLADLVADLVPALHLGAQNDGHGGTLITYGSGSLVSSADLAGVALSNVQALLHI